MPYLAQKRKDELDNNPKQALVTAGDLTYVVYKLMLRPDLGESDFRTEVGKAINRYMPKHPKYGNYAMVIGCLRCASFEWERRHHTPEGWLDLFIADYYENTIAPYEDEKIKQNGDVVY